MTRNWKIWILGLGAAVNALGAVWGFYRFVDTVDWVHLALGAASYIAAMLCLHEVSRS